MRAVCKIEGCAGLVHGHGWCVKHYTRNRTTGNPLGTRNDRAPRNEATAYFWEHLGEEGPGCLVWPYARAAGYGRVWIEGQCWVVSRYACQHRWGPPPAGRSQVAHVPLICHNPACWRGDHLRWATSQEQAQDRRIDGTVLQGERIHQAKLTEIQVLEIRRQHATTERYQRELADQYGVSRPTISNVINHKTWTHLTNGSMQ